MVGKRRGRNIILTKTDLDGRDEGEEGTGNLGEVSPQSFTLGKEVGGTTRRHF